MKEELETLEIDENHIIGSLDIKQMFPMIPVQQTLQIKREQLDKDDTLPTRTEWKPAQIIELLEVCLETHFQSYKGDIYTQTDGTPIGKSISGPLLEYLLLGLNNFLLSKENSKPVLFFGEE